MTNASGQDDLLAIDVDAEIRKLGGLRLRSAAEQVVELVRFVASQGASRIDIELHRREFSIAATGVPFNEELTTHLCTAAEPRLSQEIRHDAVVALERGGALGLLATFAPGTTGVSIVWTGHRNGQQVELTPGRSPKVSSAASGEDRLSLVVRGPRLRTAEQAATVARYCRFSSAPIYIGGVRVSRGLHLDGCLFAQEVLAGASRAIIGLPWRGDLCRIVRLSHGIQLEETFKAPQRGLLFHAVVDDSSNDGNLLEELRRCSRQLFAELSDVFDALGQEARDRAFELLIDRAEKSGQERLLEDVAGFARLGGGLLTLRAVVRLAARGSVYAVGRGDDPRRFSSVGRVVLLVDDRQRRYLETHFGVPLLAPPPRANRSTVPMSARARWSALAFRLGRVRPSSGSVAVLPDAALTPNERSFIVVLSTLVEGMSSAAGGSSGVHLGFADIEAPTLVRQEEVGRKVWVMARRNGLVLRLVEAVTEDPSLAYPALAALESAARDGREAVYDILDRVLLDLSG